MLANMMTAAAAYAVQRGVPLEQVAEAAGLAPHTLIAGPERVPEDAIAHILNLLQRRFPDEAVALDMAEAAPFQFLGPLGPVVRLVPDLRTGLEMFARFGSVLSTSVVLEFVEAPPGPMLTFAHPNDRAFGVLGGEMALVMASRVIIEGFGLPHALRHVWLDHPPTAPVERYADVFSAPVRFDAPAKALLLHAERLDDPVDPDAGARLRVLRAHLEMVRQQLERQTDAPELRRLRDAAARSVAQGDYTATALARRLGMGLRTLQRRADALGTSVRALIDEARAATAQQLLADRGLTILEVALALGYSTESAFRRACRRWTGQSPAQLRRSLG